MKLFLLNLLFISLFLSADASAQWRREVLFDVSTQSTQDSQLRLESRILLKPEIKWVSVTLTKGNQREQSVYPNTGGDFEQTLWLRFGSGQYKVLISTSTEEQKYNSLYYVDSEFTIENTDVRENMNFLFPTVEIQSDASDIIDLAESIVHGLTTDGEKTLAIHDWVATNIAYDVEAYLDGSYARKPGDALTIMRTKLAVCQGYSYLTAALNRAVGIPTKVVFGEAIRRGEKWTGNSNHAWNETLIDGKWVIQDTTWDAGYIDYVSKKFTFKLQRKYFNPDPALFQESHRAEAKP